MLSRGWVRRLYLQQTLLRWIWIRKKKKSIFILGRVCPGQLSVLHQGCHQQVCNAGIAGPGLKHCSNFQINSRRYNFLESFLQTHLVDVASGQRQRSCSRPLLGPQEPKCSEEEHRQPEEEEGINAWLSLIAFLRASLDAQNFFYRAFYLGGLWSRQTFCRSICRARLCMMQVRGTTRTPGMILLSSRPMTWPRNQAGVHSDPLEQLD